MCQHPILSDQTLIIQLLIYYGLNNHNQLLLLLFNRLLDLNLLYLQTGLNLLRHLNNRDLQQFYLQDLLHPTLITIHVGDLVHLIVDALFPMVIFQHSYLILQIADNFSCAVEV